jgi:hypothetical protein
MSDQDPTTKPTLETLLEMVSEIRDTVNRMDVRLDRMDSVFHDTRSDMLAFRADFKELRGALREHFPAVK